MVKNHIFRKCEMLPAEPVEFWSLRGSPAERAESADGFLLAFLGKVASLRDAYIMAILFTILRLRLSMVFAPRGRRPFPSGSGRLRFSVFDAVFVRTVGANCSLYLRKIKKNCSTGIILCRADLNSRWDYV